MKNHIFIFSLLLILSSCVSRGNYLLLQTQYNTLSEENTLLTKKTAENERALQKLQDEYKSLNTYSTESISGYQAQTYNLEKALQHTQFELQQSNRIRDTLLAKQISFEKGILQANTSIYKSLQDNVLSGFNQTLNSELKAKYIALSWQEQQWDNEQFSKQLLSILNNLKEQSSTYEKLTLIFLMPTVEHQNWLNKAAQVNNIIKESNLNNNIEFLFKTAVASSDNNTALHLLISSHTDIL